MDQGRLQEVVYGWNKDARLAEAATMDGLLDAMGIPHPSEAEARAETRRDEARAWGARWPEVASQIRENFLGWATDRQLLAEVRWRKKWFEKRGTFEQTDYLHEALRSGKMLGFAASSAFPMVPNIALVSSYFREFTTIISGITEFVSWTYFHVADYSAAGSTVYNFWGETDGNATYTTSGTNFTVANYMPGREAFLINRQSFTVMGAIGDIQNATASSVTHPGELHRALLSPTQLLYKVGDKEYLSLPLSLVPWGGIQAGAFSNSTVYTQAPAFLYGPSEESSIPVVVPPSVRVIGQARWNTVRTITTAGFRGWAKKGVRARPGQ